MRSRGAGNIEVGAEENAAAGYSNAPKAIVRTGRAVATAFRRGCCSKALKNSCARKVGGRGEIAPYLAIASQSFARSGRSDHCYPTTN